MSISPVQHERTITMAAEALLREHPDALVCGLSSSGLIVPLPQSIGLWGQQAIEGRAMMDVVVAADRVVLVQAWAELEREGAVSGEVRLLSQPSRWVVVHCFDLRGAYGVMLCVVLPSYERGEERAGEVELAPAPPRYATLIEDESAKVLDCDDAFTKMFGYACEALLGKSIFDLIHPEDQARAAEGWTAMLSSRRSQQTRMRRKRTDGSWVWVDSTLHNYLNHPDRRHVLVELIDVSAEMAAQEALQEREELLSRLTDAMPDGLLQVDVALNVVYHNARLRQILQGPAFLEAPDGESIAISDRATRAWPTLGNLFQTLTEESGDAAKRALGRVLAEGADEDIEVEFTLGSGESRCALLSIRSLRRLTGEISGVITSVLDVTDSVRARRELERRATFDGLTGCYNRSSILGALQRELERGDPGCTALIYVDLDNFKRVNDTLGHTAGDQVLTIVAQRLEDVTRPGDAVGRVGGDEFIMLLHDVPTPEMAMKVAHRICTSLRAPADVSGTVVQLQASVGVTCAPVTAEELVRHADAAMYQSKAHRQGKPVLDGDPVRGAS